MADLKFAVRELEKTFFREEYLRVFDEVKACGSFGRKVAYLQNIIQSASSNWSGGYSATNMEEQIRREIAVDILRTVAMEIMYDENQRQQVLVNSDGKELV
jgi:hypothetical protein